MFHIHLFVVLNVCQEKDFIVYSRAQSPPGSLNEAGRQNSNTKTFAHFILQYYRGNRWFLYFARYCSTNPFQCRKSVNIKEHIIHSNAGRTGLINTLSEPLKSLLRKIGVDRAVFYGVLAKIWTMFAGPVRLFLIATRFSPIVQGYYYSFYSFLMFQSIFELGFSMVIIQFASHEWSELRMDERGHVTGNPDALSRLASLGRFSIFWFGISGLVFMALLATGGSLFFLITPQVGVEWRFPWLALSVAAGLNLCMVPAFSILIGCNQVGVVNQFRFYQTTLVYGVIWISIITGGELWTLFIATSAGLVASSVFFWWRYGGFIRILYESRSGPSMKWFKEIWPMQWRMAIVMICGTLSSNLPVLALFHYQGPDVAGQMGMTQSLLLVLSEISISWVFTKMPLFGIFIAKKDYDTLDRMFFTTVKFSGLAFSCGSLLIIGMVFLLNTFSVPMAQRLLPPGLVILFLFSTLLTTIATALGHYLRAHKKEPYAVVSLVSGLFSTVIVLLTGKWYGVSGVAWGLFTMNSILIVPVVMIFIHYRKEWHKKEQLLT